MNAPSSATYIGIQCSKRAFRHSMQSRPVMEPAALVPCCSYATTELLLYRASSPYSTADSSMCWSASAALALSLPMELHCHSHLLFSPMSL